MSQVAGVIGHEIGHVTRRHSVQQMQKAQGANIGVSLGCILTKACESETASQVISVAGSAVFAKFSRNDEAEADAEGVRNVLRAGIDPNGVPEMFRILLDERKSSPDAVSAFFGTHPLEEDRIATTKAQIAGFTAAQMKGLTQDTPGFQAFKKKLMGLPPSPEVKKKG